MTETATLHFLCGKLASGKTTLARTIGKQTESVVICEDEWISKLYPGYIKNFHDYLKHSASFRKAIRSHVEHLLSNGVSVVLDFACNQPSERKWVRSIYESAGANHLLHYIDASDGLCKKQLINRNQYSPYALIKISNDEYDQITQYFHPPGEKEGFRTKRYDVG